MSTQDCTTRVEASCFCGQLKASAVVPSSKLPIPLYLCSCDTCRHVSGLLCITSVNINCRPNVTGHFTSYETSAGPNGLARCFCPDCGTTVFEDSENTNRGGLAGGALTKADGVVKIVGQIFVADTRDGGLSKWLPDIRAWPGDDREDASLGRSSYQPQIQADGGGDKLHCRCHCGGVAFDITRPGPDATEPQNQKYGDAAKPHEEPRANPKDDKWWVRENGSKWAASLCACHSCRRASGYDIQPWAFVPRGNILRPDGMPVTYDEGTLSCYHSSPDVSRYFCSGCGATAFFRVTDRPDLVDVSVGLMEAASGSRAEEWLSWITSRVSYWEDAQNVPLIDSLAKGLAEDVKKVELKQ